MKQKTHSFPAGRSAIFLFILCFLFSGAFTVSALDWGLNINNTTGFQYDDEASLVQEDIASVWLSHSFNENTDFRTQGSYTYTPDIPLLVDLDLLRLRYTIPHENSDSQITAGRFAFTEFTRYVLAHRLDGLRYRFIGQSLSAYAAAGYAGLNLKPNSTIILSAADDGDQGDPDIYLGPPRIIANTGLNFRELFLRQDLNVALIGQFDLRPDDDLDAGQGRTHTAYLGTGINGPLVDDLYWSGFGYFGSGMMNNETVLLGFLAGGGLNWFIEREFNSRLSFSGVYSSGDKDAPGIYSYDSSDPNTEIYTSMNFLPISESTLGVIYSPRLANIFFGRAAFSMKPWDFFQGEVSYLAFFRSAPAGIAGAPAVVPVDPTDNESLYLGSEADLRLNFRPLSDLGIAVAYGLFIPGTGDTGAIRDDSPLVHKATVNLSLKF
ncbi:MAG: hypothetical protein K9L68_13500 [Spirochaetales bacterium]|nr:hypothetical protein [Spirochaetales bacterium]MCF7939607.1 hypothetical protein [Spirochaetales bacterium]